MKKTGLFIIFLYAVTPYIYANNTFTSQTIVRNEGLNVPVNDSTAQSTIASSDTIDWKALCGTEQRLLDKTGCSPDCTSPVTNEACVRLLKNSRIEKLSYIPLPYQPHGIFIFKLDDTFVSASAHFSVFVGGVPAKDSGYVCETVYHDGTPAPMINTRYLNQTSIIAIDYRCTPSSSGGGCQSDTYVNFMSQSYGSAPTFSWIRNPNQPLYLLCLSYIENGTSPVTLQSAPGCSGAAGTCVYYTLGG